MRIIYAAISIYAGSLVKILTKAPETVCASQEHDAAEHEAQQHNAPKRLHDAFFVARAVVIAENGLRARRNSAERHGDDEHEALHDGGTRDEHIGCLRRRIFAA